MIWELEGLTSNVIPSPVYSDGMVYVIKHGRNFQVLAKNELDDRFDASPAIVDNELVLRGLKYLYCIAEL